MKNKALQSYTATLTTGNDAGKPWPIGANPERIAASMLPASLGAVEPGEAAIAIAPGDNA